ncbi:phage tail protein [Halorubrum sp. HHNYT27]|uniref:phage tail protein n=1 Tax=Halorubrum sp. HHNYT27 TaxID=3402275 RepID=UPI003EBA6F7A
MAQGEILAEIVLEGDQKFRAAVKRAGESMESAGDDATGLSARLGRVAEQMSDLVAPATLASNRVDNLGDQLNQTGRKAVAATAGVVGYSSASSAAAGSSATWSAVMSASLIPALGALSLTLGPLVATIGAVAVGAGALAAAFGTVVASGFLAYGRQLATRMDDIEKPTEALAKRFAQLRTRIANIIAPLGQQFVPLIRDVLNALPGLVQSVVNSLGPLDQFAQTLRSMGQTAMRVIPQITGALFDLARRALPVFEHLTSFLATQGPAAFDLLVESFRVARDEFRLLLGATFSALPPLLRLGNTVTQVLVPAVADIIGALGRAVERFNQLPEPLRRGAVAAGLLGSAFVVAVPAITAIAGAVSALLGPLGALVIAVSTLVGAWVADIGGMREATTHVFGAIQTELTKTFRTLDSATNGALGRVGNTIRGFVTKAQTNLSGIIRYISGQFVAGIRAIGATVRGALLTASKIWDRHSGRVKDTIRDLTGFIKQNPRETLATLATVIIPGPLGLIVEAFKRNWNEIKRTVRTALNVITDIARTTMQSFKEQIIQPARNARSEFGRSIYQMLTEGRQTFRMIRDVIRRVMGVVLTNIRERLNAIRRIWKANLSGSNGILANARTAFNSLWNNIIKPTLDLIQSAWKVFGDDLIRIFDGVLGTINLISETGLDLLLTTVNVILDLISGDWEGAWTNIKDFFQRTWNRIVDWAKTDGKQLLSGALNIIIDAAKSIFNAFYDWLIGNSFFPDLINAVANWLENTGKSLVTGAFDSIVDGIESVLNSIDVSGATSAIQDIIDKAGAAIDKIGSIPDVPDVPDIDFGGGSSGGGGDDDDGGDGGGDGSGGGGSVSSGYVGGPTTSTGFASGGIVDAPQSGMPAELHGREAVMPLDRLPEMMADTLAELDDGGGETVIIEENAIQIDAQGADAQTVAEELDRQLERLLTR